MKWIIQLCFIALLIFAGYKVYQVESQKIEITRLETRALWLEEVGEKCIEIIDMMSQVFDQLKEDETDGNKQRLANQQDMPPEFNKVVDKMLDDAITNPEKPSERKAGAGRWQGIP